MLVATSVLVVTVICRTSASKISLHSNVVKYVCCRFVFMSTNLLMKSKALGMGRCSTSLVPFHFLSV